jgi:hypothetical protein
MNQAQRRAEDGRLSSNDSSSCGELDPALKGAVAVGLFILLRLPSATKGNPHYEHYKDRSPCCDGGEWDQACR